MKENSQLQIMASSNLIIAYLGLLLFMSCKWQPQKLDRDYSFSRSESIENHLFLEDLRIINSDSQLTEAWIEKSATYKAGLFKSIVQENGYRVYFAVNSIDNSADKTKILNRYNVGVIHLVYCYQKSCLYHFHSELLSDTIKFTVENTETKLKTEEILVRQK